MRCESLPRWRSCGAALVSLMAVGCASHEPPPVVHAPPPVIAPGGDHAFDAGQKLLTGFTLGDLGSPVKAGDTVLFGVKVMKDGVDTVRFLRVTGLFLTTDDAFEATVSPINHAPITVKSRAYTTQISLFDENANILNQASGMIAEPLMSHGLYRSVGVYSTATDRLPVAQRSDLDAISRAMTEDEVTEASIGWLSLISMAISLKNNQVFNKMLFQTVEKPSLLSLIFGVKIAMGTREMPPEMKDIELAPGVTENAYVIPLRLTINDTPAMEFDLTVVQLKPPLGLCGGVTKILAWNPVKPGTRVEVQLLAAQRPEKELDLMQQINMILDEKDAKPAPSK